MWTQQCLNCKLPWGYDGSCEPCWKAKKIHWVTFQEAATEDILFDHLNLTRILLEKAPELKEREQDAQLINIMKALKFDYLYRNYIMNNLLDALYNVYTYEKTTNEL